MAEATLILDDFIPYRLSITSNLVSNVIARTYQALFGLSIPEWRVVAVVAATGPIAQSDIGQRTRMDKVAVSRAASALVSRGLVAREYGRGDRRSHQLALTASGRALYAAVAPKALELERRIFANFSCGEMEGFVAMLQRIDAIALRLDQED